MSPQAKQLTYRLIDSHCGARLLYDVNLRKDSYTAPLVRELMARGQVVKLNEDEAAAIDQMFGRASRSLEDFCRVYASEFGWQSACVTRGEKGCAMLVNGEYVEASGYTVQAQDTVGAGDAFAAAFVHGLSLQWPPAEIADFANRVAALVASRPGGTPPLDARRSPGSFKITSACPRLEEVPARPGEHVIFSPLPRRGNARGTGGKAFLRHQRDHRRKIPLCPGQRQ